MINWLRGEVAEKNDSGVVLDVGGVGYGLRVSHETFGQLQTGHAAKLIVYEHIREDAHDLYGFLDSSSKVLFEQLLSVNGVGARMALSILNVGSQDALRSAIAGGDTKYIQAATGVGKRLAERVVVELKDKVGLPSSSQATEFLQTPSFGDEAAQALVALGFSSQDASTALAEIDSSLSTEDRIRQALKQRRG